MNQALSNVKALSKPVESLDNLKKIAPIGYIKPNGDTLSQSGDFYPIRN